MANTLAQNIAANNAQRAANQGILQGGRDVQRATQELDSYFGRGSSASDPTRQGFITKNFGDAAIQRGAGFNFSGATPNPFNVMSYNLKDRSGIINTIAQNYAQERRNQEATEANKQRIAAREAAKAEAERKAMIARIEGAYGKPEDYEFQASLLGGMNPQAYYDYLATGDPQNVTGQGMGAWHTPYNVYYDEELRRNKQMGLPTGQQIQYGQVMSPGGIGGLPWGRAACET